MSIADALDWLAASPLPLAIYFLLPPLIAFALGLLTRRPVGAIGVTDYTYSVLTYLVAVPGMISLVLIGYSLFFIRQNLLEVSFLIYFAPVISMVATFGFIRRQVGFDRLPGFRRLSGLMMLIGLSFLVVLILFKTRILVGFFGSLESLLVLGIVLFLAFQFAASRLFR